MTLLCYHFEGAYAPKYFSVLSGIFIWEKVSSAQVIIVVIVSTLSAGMFFCGTVDDALGSGPEG